MPNLLERHETVEMALVGSLMLDNLKIAGVSEILSPVDFSCGDIGRIYAVILSQWGAGHEVDCLSVSAELDVSEAETAQDAQGGVGSAASAMFYAEQVRDSSTRRKLHLAAKQAASAAKDDPSPILDILEKARYTINCIGHVEKKRTTSDVILGMVQSSQEASENPHGTVGIPTGFTTLDNMTGGLRNTDLMVIAARPSIGKTALALNIIYNVLSKTDKNIVLFTAEMSPEQIWLRMIARMTNIDSNRLSRGDLDKGQWAKYIDISQKMVDNWGERLYNDPTSSPTPGYIKSISKQKQQQGKCDLVVTDYLNLMTAPGYVKEYDQVTQCARSQKSLAKDLKVPAILLAQIGRGAEDRDVMKIPGLSDLKSSGAIEEVADQVVFIHRETRESSDGLIKIAKQRNGPVGSFRVRYTGEITTFKEV